MSIPQFSTTFPSIAKAIIPAAGLGTRLRPLSQAFPKELLPIGRRPVLAHIAAELRGAGITEALFVVSERKPQIRDYFGEAYHGDIPGEEDGLPALHCTYVTQKEQHGLGDALLYAEEWAGNLPFAVAFGDCLIDAPDPSQPLRRMLATHVQQGAAATVLCEAVAREKVSRYGVLAPADSNSTQPEAPFAVADIVEKPSPAEAPSNLVVAARWVLQPEIFPYLRQIQPDVRGELSLTDAVRALRQAGGGFWAVPLRSDEKRRDIGNFETFFSAFVRAALRDPEFGDTTRRAALEELSAEKVL